MSTINEALDLFSGLRAGRPNRTQLDAEFPFYPLDAPGMSLPGPDFEAGARAMGDDPPFTVEGTGKDKRLTSFGNQIEYLYRMALYSNEFQLNVNVKGRWTPATFIPGHLIGDDTNDFNGGPRKAKIMVIGKHPGQEEAGLRQNFVGPSSDTFYEALDVLGVGEAERADWYITNLVKFPQLDRQSDALPAAWVKDCRPLLDQELRLVKPDYILCLGSHASKEVLGKWAAVTNMVGRVEELTFPVFARGEEPRYHTAKVMAATHPAAVYRLPELFDPFKDQLSLFLQLSSGVDVGARETDITHKVIYKHAQLKAIVDAIRADPDRWLIAVDGEWHGDYPTESNAYLRTIQFSDRHGEAYCVVLRHQGGYPAFKPGISYAVHELNRLLRPDPEAGYYPRVGGHFFRADLPWLIAEGVDCRESYMAPPDETQLRDHGGWDTSVAYHATNEAASYKLEDVATRLTTVPRYDKKLAVWKEEWCKKHDKSSKDLDGYGDCPAWVLHPEDDINYSTYDADATRRIIVRCMEPGGLLDADWHSNPSWKPFWVAHRASPAFLEMEMNGIMLDKDRVDKLTRTFMYAKERLLEDFRRRINWPTFNPESNKQCVAVLFGDQYAYKEGPNGTHVPIRPHDAMTLNLRPVKTTGKRSKMWDQVLSRGEAHLYNPSADKEVLGILGHEHPLAMQLRDLKFVSQVLKAVLRPPATEEDGTIETDDDGYYVYDRGLASYVHEDGRVRTHLSQVKETGRASSYRPPLQNISKRREDDYLRILGSLDDDGQYVGGYQQIFPQPLYEHPIRTIFRAAPGHVLVEVDYTGAELALLAWMANDAKMIDHCRRNILPESHPDHYDIHSRQAVAAFHLQCDPTKSGLKKSGNKGKRVAAKNVNFGVPYGRMALAIARQCREEGVDITTDEAQALIDAYFNMYTDTVAFLADCRNRVSNEKWLSTYMGRKRRFIKSHDRQVVGEQERQAQNFPIQGGVADTVSRACDHLYWYRSEDRTVSYRLLLQIHDAILFEVPIPHLRRFVQDELDDNGTIIRPSVVRECMVNRCPVWPTYLDGTRREDVTEPYYFGIDTDVQVNWGEDIPEEMAVAQGIPLDLI